MEDSIAVFYNKTEYEIEKVIYKCTLENTYMFVRLY